LTDLVDAGEMSVVVLLASHALSGEAATAAPPWLEPNIDTVDAPLKDRNSLNMFGIKTTMRFDLKSIFWTMASYKLFPVFIIFLNKYLSVTVLR
jgi:hypothetical protein